MGSQTEAKEMMVGGYFAHGNGTADLSLELPDAPALNISVKIGEQGKLRVIDSNRDVTWSETRLVRGILALKMRFDRDKAMERSADNHSANFPTGTDGAG